MPVGDLQPVSVITAASTGPILDHARLAPGCPSSALPEPDPGSAGCIKPYAFHRTELACRRTGAAAPPIQPFGALIAGYVRASLLDRALAAMREFSRQGGVPDARMVEDIVPLCLTMGNYRHALQVSWEAIPASCSCKAMCNDPVWWWSQCRSTRRAGLPPQLPQAHRPLPAIHWHAASYGPMCCCGLCGGLGPA